MIARLRNVSLEEPYIWVGVTVLRQLVIANGTAILDFSHINYIKKINSNKLFKNNLLKIE